MTINEAIAFQNQLTKRVSELSALRGQVSQKESYFRGGQSEKVVEPQYDVKLLDRKITSLQNWLFRIDAEIKKVNARTELDLIVPVEELLAPLE